MPPRALGSVPLPVPSRPAPEPSPCSPLPGPLPLPMLAPPPLPPRPVLAVPVGDMARAPLVEFGSPTFVPGWLETTTPLPAAFPPALLGGDIAVPRSSGLPPPAPLLPRPLPERALPPPKPGGGGMTLAAPSSETADCPERPFAWVPVFPPSMLAGGGTTWGVSVAAPDLASELPPDAVGGGGTGLGCMSPVAELPQLLRSRLTCDGGGATTAGAGSDILGVDDTSRWGAETGGATTSTVCVIGRRELARSRCVSCGAGAMTVCASGLAVCILSRETFGAGSTTVVLMVAEERALACVTSGAGGMTFVVRLLAVRLVEVLSSGEGGMTLVVRLFAVWRVEEFSSGEGGTTLIVIAGSAGAVRVERRPSAGGGPGFDLNASRLATAESEWGRFTLGASTTFSLGLSPRATRMAWVRWWACSPPARPDLPDCAPPRSCVCGSSSPE